MRDASDGPRRSTGLYFSHPACLGHDPREHLSQHPDTPERLLAIEERLASRDWLGWERREAPAATDAELELVHDRSHVEAIRDLCAGGGGAIDPDTYVCEASLPAALHAAGGACEMTRALLADGGVGFCAVRPAGHHAEPDRAMGFCLFDNVAIAAELAIRELGVKRVFVFDWDVHHGNGTVEAFRRRPDVLVAGIHQEGIYPGTGSIGDLGSGPGEGFTVNLPVPAGSGEDVWLSLLEHLVIPVATTFQPGLLLVSAGFDAHVDDPLAQCRLESVSFARMSCHLRDLAASLGVPLGMVLEGGYDLAALADSVEATLTALGGEGEVESVAPDPILTSRAAATLSRHWDL
jgi:acetoin utilization deacetylase AcuC-like enzyme